jgi:membrane associated rhomboid family serine protease
VLYASSATTWGWILSFVVSVVLAYVCARIAVSKGRSGVLFGILGFFFSIITLIVIIILPRKDRR